MRSLYPKVEPYNTRRLPVDDLHTLYVEECGNPSGVPALYLHGGPGGGIEERSRRFFDPEGYRIVLFDQRGAGKSRPHAELERNTTAHLLADIETVRETLGVERWLVFGGSWGSSLSMLYAQAHPDRVLGLVLRGIFLCRPFDFDWIYVHGAPTMFPDHYEEYVAEIPEEERDDMVRAFHRRVTSDDEAERKRAARTWALWEARTSTLRPSEETVESLANPETSLAMARLELHYFVNDCFLEPNQILRDVPRIRGIPGWIVHGRYDAVCPPRAAWDLHRAWPEAELRWIPDAGHADTEPGITGALIEATDTLLAKLRR